MAGEENRIFVGGLAGSTTEKDLEEAFSRYGKIVDSLIMVERDTGRPRGFGFITFADRRAMIDAIRNMHNQELHGRVISVNKAQPKPSVEDSDYGHSRDHISGGRDHITGGRDSYRGGDRLGGTDCFKCGRPGHFARECPSADGGGDRFGSHSRFGGGGGRGSRFVMDRYDDRFDGGRYDDRDRWSTRDNRYGNRDRYDRYVPGGDRIADDRYIDREPQNGYGKDRGYDRDGGPRGAGDRYGNGGAVRYDRGSYRDKPSPYDRPRREGRPSYDQY